MSKTISERIFYLQGLYDQYCNNGNNLFDLPGAELTDTGNALRFAMLAYNDCRYCALLKKWLIWDGKRWSIDEKKEIILKVKGINQIILKHAIDTDDEKLKEVRTRYCLGNQSTSRIHNMLDMAGAELGVHPDEFDTDPWLLNVENGKIDLRSCKLKPHDRKDNILKIASVTYDPKAECPIWLKFLGRIMRENEDLIGFLQRAVGWSLTGDRTDHVLFVLYGTGANGKSTFLNTMHALLGDYALQIPTEALMVNNQTSISNDVARLRGARLVTAVEADEGARLNEPLIKQLTGGDFVAARHLYQETIQFKPECKIWLSTNHKPRIRGTDHAIWRRIRLIPFRVTIPEQEQDLELGEKLLAELPGILNWALEGYLNWGFGRIGNIPEIEEATAAYRSSMDILGEFFESCCELAKTAEVTNKDLRDQYIRWCEGNAEKPLSQRAFTGYVEERGFDSYKDRDGKKWLGLRLKGEDL